MIHSYFSQHKNCSIPELEGQSDNPNQKLIYQGIKSPPVSGFFTRKPLHFLMIPSYPPNVSKKAPPKADHHGEILDVEGKVLQLQLFAELPMDEPHELQRRFSYRVLPGEPSGERKIVGDSKKNAKLVIICDYVICLMSPILILIYAIFLVGNPGIRHSM